MGEGSESIEGGAAGRTRSDVGGTAGPARDLAPATALVVLAGIVALGAALRAIGLDAGLWLDEINSLREAFRQTLAEILVNYHGENDHPLYSLLARACIDAFGESNAAIRLPAAVFGAACVPMAYALARAAGMRRIEGLAAAALLATSYHHVWFSQNARAYSATSFFALAATWTLLRGAADGRMRYFAGYGILAALSAYAHLATVFAAVGQAAALGLHAALHADGRERRAITRGAVVGFPLAALLTAAAYLPKLERVAATFGRPTVWQGTSTIGWAVAEAGRGLVAAWGAGSAVAGLAAVVAGAPVVAAGLVAFARSRPLLVPLVVLPPAMVLAGSWLVRGVAYPRFLFFASGTLVIVAVRGLFALSARITAALGRPELRDGAAAAGVAAGILLSAATLPANYRYPKQDYEGAANWIVGHARPGERVFVLPEGSPFRTHLGMAWRVLCPGADTTFAAALARARESGPIWVAWTLPVQTEGLCPGSIAALARECPSPRSFPGTVGGGTIRVCRIDAAPGAPAGAAR